MKLQKELFKSFGVVKSYSELTEAEKRKLDKGAARNRREALYTNLDGVQATFLGCEFTSEDKLFAFVVDGEKVQIPSYLFRTQRLWTSTTPIEKADVSEIRKCEPEPFAGLLKGLTPDNYKFEELGYELAVSQKLTDKDGNGLTVQFRTKHYTNAIGFWEGSYYTTNQRKCVVIEPLTVKQPETDKLKTTRQRKADKK